jgi:hypothetical protein
MVIPYLLHQVTNIPNGQSYLPMAKSTKPCYLVNQVTNVPNDHSLLTTAK